MQPTTTIKVRQKDLSNALQAASRVTLSPYKCENKCLKHIYSCIVFRVGDCPSVEVMGSDWMKVIATTVALTGREGDARSFAIMKEDITPIIRRLDDQELVIELYEYQATFRHSCGSFKVPLVKEDLDEVFSRQKEMASRHTTQTLELEAPFFRSMLDRLCKYAAQDQWRPAMAGICIKRKGGKVEYTASDGHRLIRITKADTECTLESSLLIPIETLSILRWITPRTGFVTIDYSEWNNNSDKKPVCHIGIDTVTELWFTPTEGKYPNYNAAIPIPNKYDWKFKVQRMMLSKSLDRMDLFCPTTNTISLQSYKDKVIMSAEDKDFGLQASETLPVEHETPTFHTSFGIRIRNMQNILSTIKDKEIYIQGISKVGTPKTITSVSPTEGEEVTIIFMPCVKNSDMEE